MNEPDELNRLLSTWAAQQRMTSDQVSALRAHVLAGTATSEALDTDWMWSLLKPVTRLMDRLDFPPAQLDRAARWLPSATTEAHAWTSYLQLAPAG
jgi:hypothetical protein